MNFNCANSKCIRSGFTALELLVALVLAASLITAVGGVLNLVAKQANVVKQRTNDLVWKRHLRELIDRDFKNSRSIKTSRNSITLNGFLQTLGGRTCLGDARVVYSTKRLGTEWRLIRSIEQGRETTVQIIDHEIKFLKVVELNGLDVAGRESSAITEGEPPSVLQITMSDPKKNELFTMNVLRE